MNNRAKQRARARANQPVPKKTSDLSQNIDTWRHWEFSHGQHCQPRLRIERSWGRGGERRGSEAFITAAGLGEWDAVELGGNEQKAESFFIVFFICRWCFYLRVNPLSWPILCLFFLPFVLFLSALLSFSFLSLWSFTLLPYYVYQAAAWENALKEFYCSWERNG